MTPAQMEQLAAMYRAEGYSASVTPNARHVIAIKAPEWLADMKIGNVVTLKSGSPKMTIIQAQKDDLFLCGWFGHKTKYRTATFTEQSLDIEEPIK